VNKKETFRHIPCVACPEPATAFIVSTFRIRLVGSVRILPIALQSYRRLDPYFAHFTVSEVFKRFRVDYAKFDLSPWLSGRSQQMSLSAARIVMFGAQNRSATGGLVSVRPYAPTKSHPIRSMLPAKTSSVIGEAP
jgi:hypothetical protein